MTVRPTHRPRAIALLLAGLLLLTAGAAAAGSICGLVTDGQTAQPVADAGVFLRDAQGTYLGLYAATDAGGHYCLDDLAAGTYTLEVRVDDYVAAWIENIVVQDGPSTVPISALLPDAWLHLPWPNPAAGRVHLRLTARRDGPLDLAVYDLRGRVVRHWEGQLAAGDRDFTWDGRDPRGQDLPTGLYFIRLRSGDRTMTRPVLLTR